MPFTLDPEVAAAMADVVPPPVGDVLGRRLIAQTYARLTDVAMEWSALKGELAGLKPAKVPNGRLLNVHASLLHEPLRTGARQPASRADSSPWEVPENPLSRG